MRLELDSQPGLTIDRATERQLRELKPLQLEQRLELARQIDFASATVREVRQIVECVKAAAHVSHNSGNNEWYTPTEYIQAARRVMGDIYLDPASSQAANRIVNAWTYYTRADDGLEQHWHGNVWMNPPYASHLIGQFTEKLARHYGAGDVRQAIVLVNNATETNWFQELLAVCSAACFVKRRIKFIDSHGNPSGAPLQGQAILYLGNNAPVFAREFSGFGTVLYGRDRARSNQE